MKKVGKFAIMLSLIAMAPSFARTASPQARVCKVKPEKNQIDASHFKGIEHRIVFIDNSYCANGDGSFLRPYSTLEAAQDGSKPGQILYVIAREKPYTTSPDLDNDLDYDDSSALITLKPSQSLISSGCTLKIGDKVIPATTPGEFATISIGGYADTGIIMTNCNHVCGFIFTSNAKPKAEIFGTAISSRSRPSVGIPETTVAQNFSGVGGKNVVTKNIFQNLESGVDVELQGWSSIEISSNRFENVLYGVSLDTEDGSISHICDNTFEGSMVTAISSSAIILNRSSDSLNINNLKVSSSDAAELFIERNEFEGTAKYAVQTNGTKRVDLCKNKISGEIEKGFEIVQYTPIRSVVNVLENYFDTLSLNVLSLSNAKAKVEKNKFYRGSYYGLGIFSIIGDVTASVKENCFEGQVDAGFTMCVYENATSPCCLELVNNSTSTEFRLDNYSRPEFFEAEICDNRGNLNLLSEITLVKHCPKCN